MLPHTPLIDADRCTYTTEPTLGTIVFCILTSQSLSLLDILLLIVLLFSLWVERMINSLAIFFAEQINCHLWVNYSEGSNSRALFLNEYEQNVRQNENQPQLFFIRALSSFNFKQN